MTRALPDDPHRRAAYVRCERLDCLRVTIAYATSQVDGMRICFDCWRDERAS
jgi:hypothetical protein